MQLSKRIKLEKQEVEYPTEKLLIKFDDPPGPSPGRFIGPLYDLDAQEYVRQERESWD